MRNFHEFFIESLKANAQRWKDEDVFFWGNFIILSPFPHPSPAFPKQPENCQLYHNFYLLHRCATPPPPSIHIFSFNQWSMVEKRIFRYFPCDYLSIFNPDNSGLFCGLHKFRASAMLVSLKVKHKSWDAHMDGGHQHHILIEVSGLKQHIFSSTIVWMLQNCINSRFVVDSCRWGLGQKWAWNWLLTNKCHIQSFFWSISISSWCWKTCRKNVHLQLFCFKRFSL